MEESAAGARTCQSGRVFARCQGPAIDTCQYCGHHFCTVHSYYREGHEAVCTRKRCRRKRDDMRIHEQYQTGVKRRNLLQQCGDDECRFSPLLTCSFCNALFCDMHLKERRWGFRDNQASYERIVSLCDHCWGRRKVWQ